MKPIFLLILLVTAQITQAACPSFATNQRFTFNEAEVTDTLTSLIWKRCAEGQSWSGGSCSGSAAAYTHEQALALAKQANANDSPNGWRLPNVKELSSLADKGCQNPAIDSTAFPNTRNDRFWSSSPSSASISLVWVVNFNSGFVDTRARHFTHHVRLVRVNQ